MEQKRGGAKERVGERGKRREARGKPIGSQV